MRNRLDCPNLQQVIDGGSEQVIDEGSDETMMIVTSHPWRVKQTCSGEPSDAPRYNCLASF